MTSGIRTPATASAWRGVSGMSGMSFGAQTAVNYSREKPFAESLGDAGLALFGCRKGGELSLFAVPAAEP
jgi:hypothetical protein